MTRKTICKLLALLSVAAILWLLAEGILLLRRIEEREKTLRHFQPVLIALHDYMSNNQGKWPTSWDDLDNFVTEHPVQYYLEHDSQERRRRIKVRFDISGKDVAQMDVASFTAIAQQPPCYIIYDNEKQLLIDTARKYHGHDKNVPK